VRLQQPRCAQHHHPGVLSMFTHTLHHHPGFSRPHSRHSKQSRVCCSRDGRGWCPSCVLGFASPAPLNAPGPALTKTDGKAPTSWLKHLQHQLRRQLLVLPGHGCYGE
jgi:hypothetical protein